MDNAGWIQFTLNRQPGAPLAVSLRRAGERWVAQLDDGRAAIGFGVSAQAALRAALEPYGRRAVTRLLADVALLEPSCRVLELEGRANT